MDENDQDPKIVAISKSGNFKEYQEEQFKVLDKWQYIEPASLTLEDRFELDKEAYINNYYDSAYSINGSYKEETLLKRLIDNLKEAKHPVWAEYRDYLDKKLLDLQNPLQINEILKNSYTNIFSNDIGFTIFEKWYNEYKKSPNKLAHFSYIYNALNKDLDVSIPKWFD